MKEVLGIGLILGLTSCKYMFPLTYPDTISLWARITGIEDDRISMKYVIMSHRHERIAAEGDGVIAMYNYRAGIKIAVPNEIRKRTRALE